MAAVFATATDEQKSTVTVESAQVAVVVRPLRFASCVDATAQLKDVEVAHARLVYSFRSKVASPQKPVLVVALALPQTIIEIPDIGWDNMSELDHARVQGLSAAIINHEVGHVRVALDDIKQINDRDLDVSGGLYDEQLHHVVDELSRDERAYDDVSDHGRRQDSLPAPLRGSNTVIDCR